MIVNKDWEALAMHWEAKAKQLEARLAAKEGEMTKTEFTPVANALESNIDAALARIRELEAQLAEANARADTCANSALEVLGSCFCDTHGKKVAQISFMSFHAWAKELGCHACAYERAEKAEAEAARLRNLLEQSRHLYGRNGKESVELLESWRLRVEAALRPPEGEQR